MRHPKWQFVGLVLFVALLSVRCGPSKRVPALVKPSDVEIQGAEPLKITVTDVWKRPLRPEELQPTDKAGFLWEYKVKIANQGNAGVSLELLRLNVENLWGQSWREDHPLNLNVKRRAEEQISVAGRLGSSDPEALPGLTGVETLTFLGRSDDGNPISFTVRVPLH
jgi:hypothetical protein